MRTSVHAGSSQRLARIILEEDSKAVVGLRNEQRPSSPVVTSHFGPLKTVTRRWVSPPTPSVGFSNLTTQSDTSKIPSISMAIP
jgi:hypothetical protein